MTHTPLTKAEREELRRLHDYASGRFTMRINGENDCRVELANGPSDDERGLHARFRYATGAHAFVAINNHLPRLLADLDAAETERETLRQIAEGCCNATDGGCSPGVSVEFLRGVPKEVGRIRDERDRAESELDEERKMRVEAEAASDRMVAERDKLRAIVERAVGGES